MITTHPSLVFYTHSFRRHNIMTRIIIFITHFSLAISYNTLFITNPCIYNLYHNSLYPIITLNTSFITFFLPYVIYHNFSFLCYLSHFFFFMSFITIFLLYVIYHIFSSLCHLSHFFFLMSFMNISFD